MKILHVVGARPNFMKLAPVYSALKNQKVSQLIVHSGQHYSANMSDVFFRDLDIPKPDINLEIGSGSQAEQVGKIMIAFEKVVSKDKPDLVVVYGDVNSTMAASIVCAKLGIKIAHVEAGLRSRDMTMPEEINRIVTDRLANLYLTPSEDADVNLFAEGVDKKKIFFVGNVMIDTLIKFLDKPCEDVLKINGEYLVLTLHRPSNVDDENKMKKIMQMLEEISQKIKIVFPVHPRTKKQLNIRKGLDNIIFTEPLGYLQFINVLKNAKLVVTDSGGIQEETTYLKIPCLTMRNNTERPITVEIGSNTLVGDDYELLKQKIDEILSGAYKKSTIPKLWDGKAAERIAEVICQSNV